MAQMTYIEKDYFERLFDMEMGYVLDFTNYTYQRFVADTINIDVYKKYHNLSKAKILRAIMDDYDNVIVGKLLLGLMQYMQARKLVTDEKNENGELLPDDDRLTRFGKALRSTSLDELPELFNILRGDMAVVGPRPLLVQYLPLYNKHQARRHEVRSGFTGYAQVRGRNAITWEEKFDKDVYYVDHVSFFGDWKIIFQTVKTVLKREGINSETAATMEYFTGTKV